MPRRREVQKRKIQPDPKYGDRTLGRFTSVIMRDGKKNTAERIIYGAFDIIESKTRNDPLAMFRRALDNVRPRLEVRPERANSLAMRWIVTSARSRQGKSMTDKLANELIDAANERGEAVKKREDTHRMADANKAFSHYRW